MTAPTPTERAVSRLRALRAVGRSQDNDCGLLLAGYDQLEGSEQQLQATAAIDARHIGELESEIDQLKARLRAVLDACTAADQQYPTTGCPRDPAIRVSTIRQAAGQATAVTA